MAVQWAEDEKLEEILELRKREGSSLKAEITHKVLELVVHGRMSQGEQTRGTSAKKKVKGWSTEEMKDKQSSSWEEDIEGVIDRRSMRQEEMDQCWKEFSEKMEEEVLDTCKVEDSKRDAYRGSVLEWRRVRRSGKYRIRKVGRRLLGKNLRLVQRVQFAVSAKACRRIPRKKKR